MHCAVLDNRAAVPLLLHRLAWTSFWTMHFSCHAALQIERAAVTFWDTLPCQYLQTGFRVDEPVSILQQLSSVNVQQRLLFRTTLTFVFAHLEGMVSLI